MPSAINLITQLAVNIKNTDYKALFSRKPDIRKLVHPFGMMCHPLNHLYEIKYKKRGSHLLAGIIALLFFSVKMISIVAKGFIFNTVHIESLNLWLVFVQTDVLLILWCLSNWALCTLMDGEGKFGEIWISSCYSMMPAVVFTVPLTIISRFLLAEEGAVLSMADTAITAWCAALLFLSMMYVHQYSFKKTLLSMFLSACGIAVILFLTILIFSLFQQFFIFLNTVFSEISFRAS